MAINLDRKSPGIVGILFGASLSVALGVLLGLINLVAQPVEVVNALPKEPVEGRIYFVKGGSSGAGRAWELKAEGLAEGRGAEVGFSEAELNAWSGATFEEVKVEPAEKQNTVMVIAGTPNFRIVDRELQVGTINQLVFFGFEAPLVLQARGAFVRGGAGWDFKPSEAYLGGLPLHLAPALADLVRERLTPAASAPTAVAKVLASADKLEIAEGELVVRLP
ncbi:MAG: hypothetical protein MUE42_11830 [Opitutaceae bacterium]|jgi:hypothetical protein|nr:hypothetical protein [Opitutaceae bacterium]